MPEQIFAVLEHADGAPAASAYEAVSLCLTMLEKTEAMIIGVAVGPGAEQAAHAVSTKTGIDVIAASTDSPYNSEVMRHVLGHLAQMHKPAYIVAGGTSQGMDYAPGLAVRLGGSCVSGVRGVEKSEKCLGFVREVQAGKLHALVMAASRPTVLLAQPGVFSGRQWHPSSPGKVETVDIDPYMRRTRNVDVQPRETGKSDLNGAEVIVAVGRGIGKPENLELAEKLATLFNRSAVAGSRPVCDSGWLAYLKQVGITGQTVAPKLYIAAGISGASQHVSAMAGSGFVVSINNDPQAAIFNVSDVCIVEDLVKFIPLLVKSLNTISN